MSQNKNTLDVWKQSLLEASQSLETFRTDEKILSKLSEFTDLLAHTFKNKGTAFSCGNGGSHCDALHFAEEWTGRYRKERRPLAALALGEATHSTCVSNDYGFEHVFERQVEALGRAGDCLILLSTSGNSKNLILAAQKAKSIGIKSVGLLGRDGGILKNHCDLVITVPAQTSDRIQEIHIKIIHTVIESVERILFPELY
jgi:D-sedoheptulose 7-phosphate isomerase